MVDIHSHILNNIDDGSKSIEESLEIIKKYKKNQINNIVLTPHYMVGSKYIANNKKKKELFDVLQKRVKKENIDINLYLGNEIYACDNIIDLIKENEVMPINNSKYLLIEFPIYIEDKQSYNIIHNIILSGYIPIIAHPERYRYAIEDFDILKRYIELGGLLQINKDSLFGGYGKKSKALAKKLIKKRMVSFVGTDIHSIDRKIYSSKRLKNKIIRLSNKKYCNRILNENGYKIINDEIITK